MFVPIHIYTCKHLNTFIIILYIINTFYPKCITLPYFNNFQMFVHTKLKIKILMTCCILLR